jgi:hypothetical protein
MLGISQMLLKNELESELRISSLGTPILPNQDELFRVVADSVAKVIVKNNGSIEQQLRSAGIKL